MSNSILQATVVEFRRAPGGVTEGGLELRLVMDDSGPVVDSNGHTVTDPILVRRLPMIGQHVFYLGSEPLNAKSPIGDWT